MKRKLLGKKSLKTLTSLRKNLQQRCNGINKEIKSNETKHKQVEKDIRLVEDLIEMKIEMKNYFSSNVEI